MCPICIQTHLKRKYKYRLGWWEKCAVGDTLQRAATKVGYYSKIEAGVKGRWGVDSAIK